MGLFKKREIYYYNTETEFDAVIFAEKLYKMLRDEILLHRKRGIVLLCIGTDRSTGDSLGPLIGYKLKEKNIRNIQILGTLENPVHAMNLEMFLEKIAEEYREYLVIAVDASVGSKEHVGYITLGKGALRPGLGVSKHLRAVGDIFITGVVGGSGICDPMMLQNIRLATVMRMADCITESICIVEKLCNNKVLV